MLAMLTFTFSSFADQAEVEAQLQQMEASGAISAQEAEITRKYMAEMGRREWQEVKQKAKDCMERNPAEVEQVANGQQLSKNACD